MHIRISHNLPVCKIKNWEPAYQICYCLLMAWFQKVKQLKHCFSSVWLVCCSTCSQSKSGLVTKRKQNDITLL